MFFILSDLNVNGMLSQILIIIFEVQRKMNNTKIMKREAFQVTKHIFFFGPFLLSNLITFLFLIHLKRFKML